MSGFDKDNSEKTHEQQVTYCRQAEICHHGILSQHSCEVIKKINGKQMGCSLEFMDNGAEHIVLTDNPKVALLKVYISALERISVGVY